MEDPRLGMNVEQAIASGLEALSDRRWHDALDHFEVPYHHARGAERTLWLCFIRLSAALYHRDGGRRLAGEKLSASALELLASLSGHVAGFDVKVVVATFAAAATETTDLRFERRPA